MIEGTPGGGASGSVFQFKPIAFDSFSTMIHRQRPLAILTCLNLWVVGKQLFDAIVLIARGQDPLWSSA